MSKPSESFVSEHETLAAFVTNGHPTLVGVDARDGRGVMLELHPHDALALAGWIVANVPGK